jgi:hypothetical protein
MLTPPGHLISPLVFPGIGLSGLLNFVFLTGTMSLIIIPLTIPFHMKIHTCISNTSIVCIYSCLISSYVFQFLFFLLRVKCVFRKLVYVFIAAYAIFKQNIFMNFYPREDLS